MGRVRGLLLSFANQPLAREAPWSEATAGIALQGQLRRQAGRPRRTPAARRIRWVAAWVSLWAEEMISERKKPLTRPATAGESAVAVHPLPKGEGYICDLANPRCPAEDMGNDQPLGEGAKTFSGVLYEGALPTIGIGVYHIMLPRTCFGAGWVVACDQRANDSRCLSAGLQR